MFGLLLFNIYMMLFGQIMESFNISYNIYTDIIQLHFSVLHLDHSPSLSVDLHYLSLNFFHLHTEVIVVDLGVIIKSEFKLCYHIKSKSSPIKVCSVLRVISANLGEFNYPEICGFGCREKISAENLLKHKKNTQKGPGASAR